MIDWNPKTRPYCAGCPNYQCEGNYVYELERDPNMRKCRHLKRCKWVSDRVMAGMQTRMEVPHERP